MREREVEVEVRLGGKWLVQWARPDQTLRAQPRAPPSLVAGIASESRPALCKPAVADDLHQFSGGPLAVRFLLNTMILGFARSSSVASCSRTSTSL